MLWVQAVSRAGEHRTAPGWWQELLWGFGTLCCLFQHSSPIPPPRCSSLVFQSVYRWFSLFSRAPEGSFWFCCFVFWAWSRRKIQTGAFPSHLSHSITLNTIWGPTCFIEHMQVHCFGTGMSFMKNSLIRHDFQTRGEHSTLKTS